MNTSPETIWKAEVEDGLLSFIGQYMTVRVEGVVTPVKAHVREPDETLKHEQFPCMTVYGTFDRENVMRRQYDRFHSLIVNRDKEKFRAVVEKPPHPIDSHYQIDFWSLSNRQMNDMTRKWLDMCLRFFNLDCRDVSDNLRNIFCCQQGDLKKADYFDRERKVRVFHSIIDYRIWVEIYERGSYTVPIVKEGGVVFRLHQKDKDPLSEGGS